MFKWKKYRAISNTTLNSIYGTITIWQNEVVEVKKRMLGGFHVKYDGVTYWTLTDEELQESFEQEKRLNNEKR